MNPTNPPANNPPTTNPPASIPQPTAVQATPVVTTGGKSKSKTFIIAAILGLILVALIAGGAYYYLNMQQSMTPPPAQVTQPTSQLIPPKSPSPEDELNALTVDGGEKDFSAVDKDLQSL